MNSLFEGKVDQPFVRRAASATIINTKKSETERVERANPSTSSRRVSHSGASARLSVIAI
jgi:hypothetical protein